MQAKREYVTTTELAATLGCPVPKVRELIREGTIPVAKIVNGSYLLSPRIAAKAAKEAISRKPRRIVARQQGQVAMKELSSKLITLRRLKGFETGSDAARFLNIKPHHYLALERAERGLTLGTLSYVLDKFGATFRELVMLEPSEPSRPGGVIGRTSPTMPTNGQSAH